MSSSEQRVDERRNRRAFGQHDESAEYGHDDEHWQQPVFLALQQERCEFAKKRHHRALRIGSLGCWGRTGRLSRFPVTFALRLEAKPQRVFATEPPAVRRGLHDLPSAATT